MSDTPFFRTRMGQAFFDGTLPRLVAAVEQLSGQAERFTGELARLNVNFERLASLLERAEAGPSDAVSAGDEE